MQGTPVKNRNFTTGNFNQYIVNLISAQGSEQMLYSLNKILTIANDRTSRRPLHKFRSSGKKGSMRTNQCVERQFPCVCLAGHRRMETSFTTEKTNSQCRNARCNVRCFLGNNDNRNLKVLMERHLSSFLIVKNIPKTGVLIQVESRPSIEY